MRKIGPSLRQEKSDLSQPLLRKKQIQHSTDGAEDKSESREEYKKRKK